MASILVCDDQRSICEMLDISLRKDGHRVETVNGGEAAKKKLSSANYELLITDIKMPQTDGIEVLRFARQSSPETSVILITAVEDYEAAVQAVKGGAFDYIHKGPGLLEELKLAVGRALETLVLQRENLAFKRDAASRNSLENFIGSSPVIEKLKTTIRTVAPTASTVLIYGESGTGKELVRALCILFHSRLGAVCLHQLRRVPGNAAGKRALWIRKRRFHRRQPEQARPF
jgi:Response regulator containing CheY-like receiver, AAA-type ATPase, and DNA-binding domains